MVLHLERPSVESGRPFRKSPTRVKGRVTGGLERLEVVEVKRSGQVVRLVSS